MTQSLSPAAGTVVLSPSRRVVRAVAVVACLPYLGLKVAWIAGSHVGIPDGSSLLEHRTTMAVANSVTVLMDGAVIVLALVLTRPWGLRTPAWLLAFPVWVATGLLAPIMAGFPLQLLVKTLGASGHRAAGSGREPFLDAWVFGVVYTGFIVQGLCLGALFVLYARDRWGWLWRGRVWELPRGAVGPAQRATAVAAAVLSLLPLTLHLLWACGGTAGLSDGRAADRTADFYVLQAVYVVFLVAAVTGGWLIAFRRGRALPVKVPLAAAWVGSGAVACWGGWLSLVSLGGVDDIADRPTQLMNLAYAGEMIVGILVATIGAYFFAERSARAPQPSA
ncbi:hypothetical protein GR925_06575 [Streptomyces sp. HUCO-GS316]|uniref:hypothetical protein n=1 Tax=Streptomyces sp. HUCO-GS316 TaxID=2692198 RepID=UPI00136D748F|nr:hypothetical protein [Streptomyces sp. HUCO-GS316]MXM63121.1 hypothetical protein [Streptomyces sp. HUCO-GS316]